MNRIVLMVLRNIFRVPGLYAKLCHYAKNTDDYPEAEKWAHIHKIMQYAVSSGNIDLKVTGTPSDSYGVAQLYVYSVDGEYNSFCNTTYAGEGNTPVVTEPVVTEPTPTQPEVTEPQPSQPTTTGTVKAEIIGDWLWTSTVETRGATTLMDEYAKAGITDVYVLVKGTGGKVGWNSNVSGTFTTFPKPIPFSSANS